VSCGGGTEMAGVPVLTTNECCVLAASEWVNGGDGDKVSDSAFSCVARVADPRLSQFDTRTHVPLDTDGLPGGPILDLPVGYSSGLHLIAKMWNSRARAKIRRPS